MFEKLWASKGEIHVVGVSGTEGSAVALFLIQRGLKVVTHDFSEEVKFAKNLRRKHLGYTKKEQIKILQDLRKLPFRKTFQKNYLEGIEKACFIFVSQNWKAYQENKTILLPLFKKSPEKFHSITQLYFELFPGKILGITGSTGKTTTANMLDKILSTWMSTNLSSGQSKYFFSGNDRRSIQVLDKLQKAKAKDLLLLEVSNRQLGFKLPKAPEIAVITSLSPNHLDEYPGGWKEYRKIKFNLFKQQERRNFAIFNLDSPACLGLSTQSKADVYFVSTRQQVDKGACLVDKQLALRFGRKTIFLGKKEDFLFQGEHNFSNALTAALSAHLAGVPSKKIREGLLKFKKIAQRMEKIAFKRGVYFVNDTAATSSAATSAALKSFPAGKIILIAGGRSKENSKREFFSLIKEKTKAVFCLSGTLKIPGSHSVNTLEEAVKKAFAKSEKGDVILFSPAAEFFSFFEKKLPRGGRNFRQIVKNLPDA